MLPVAFGEVSPGEQSPGHSTRASYSDQTLAPSPDFGYCELACCAELDGHHWLLSVVLLLSAIPCQYISTWFRTVHEEANRDGGGRMRAVKALAARWFRSAGAVLSNGIVALAIDPAASG